MTLPELVAAFDAAATRRKRQFELATVSAWQTARLMRTDPKKRLPKLSTLFGEFGDKAPQTRSQMAGVLRGLSQMTGIPLRQVAAHG
jgi:hypothetical protein